MRKLIKVLCLSVVIVTSLIAGLWLIGEPTEEYIQWVKLWFGENLGCALYFMVEKLVCVAILWFNISFLDSQFSDDDNTEHNTVKQY